MKKGYRFDELSNLAQIFAVYDYLRGWAETHGENSMNFPTAYDILLVDTINEVKYFKDGTPIQEEEEDT